MTPHRRRCRLFRPRSGSAPADDAARFHHIIDDSDREIIQRVRPYTLTSELRLEALIHAVRYVVARGIPGTLTECGVWRGGSVLTMALELLRLGVEDRDLYLFDTFEGMTEPSPQDTSPYQRPGIEEWQEAVAAGERPWGEAFELDDVSEQRVRELLLGSNYPAERLHTVPGPVQVTLPGEAPEQIALLRLDTDWYDSTRHELVHLYPRLVDGGVLVIDDYGHWSGCRRAVDEYFGQQSVRPLLFQRVDYTCRIAVKH